MFFAGMRAARRSVQGNSPVLDAFAGARLRTARLVGGASLWCLASLSAQAQPIADPAAPIQFRPRVGVSGSGAPLVDIARPSFGGVSHNKFQRYDVDRRGVILNNSGLGGTSVIGGAVAGNPNLAGSPAARVILNEVTSSARSTLNGPTEVFGQRADVIVANPNGVVCSGCGFVNAGRVTLTTGVPTPDYATGAVGLDVSRGVVEISGAGVSTAGGQTLRAIDLVGRQLSIQAPIAASEEVRLRAGAGAYDPAADRWSGQVSASAPTLAGPAIVSGAAGKISAGTLSVVSSELDLDVTLEGPIAALSGPLTIRSAGAARAKGADAAGDLSISASGAVTLQGVHRALGRITVEGAHVVVEAGAEIAANDDLLVSAVQSLVSRGVLRSGQSISLVSQGSLLASGIIGAQGQAILQARDLSASGLALAAGRDGRLVGVERLSLADAQIGAGGDLRLSAPRVELGRGTAFQAPGVIGIDARDALVNDATLAYPNLRLSALGSYKAGATGALVEDALLLNLREGIDNAGLLAGRQSVELIAQSLVNRDAGVVSGPSVAIALTGDLANLGRILSQTTLAVVARDVTNQGEIAAGGALTLRARSYAADSSAAVLAARGADLIVAEDLRNQGRILAADALAARAGAFVNAGSGVVGATSIEWTILGDASNAGQIGARRDLTIVSGGVLANAGEIFAQTGAASIAARAGALNLGSISAGEALSLEGAAFDNAAGGARVFGADVALRIDGDVSNRGLLQARNDLTIVARSFANAPLQALADDAYAGLARAGRVSMTLSADMTNFGAVLSGGDLAIEAAGLANAGEISAVGGVGLRLSNALDNEGRVLAGDRLAIAAGAYRAGSEQARAQGRDVALLVAGEIDNGGLILASRDLDVAAGAARNRGAGAQIAAEERLRFAVGGDLSNDGLIDGATHAELRVGADAVNRGVTRSRDGALALTVGRGLDNAGSILAQTDLSLAAGSLLNRLDARVSGDRVALRVDGALDNQGALLGRALLAAQAGAATNAAFDAARVNGLIAAKTLALVVQRDFANAGVAIGQDAAAISAATLANSGEISGDALALEIAGRAANSGRIQARGALNLGAGAYAGEASAILHADVLELRIQGALVNAGLAEASTRLDARAGSVANAGVLQSAGGASLLVVGDVENSGRILTLGPLRAQAGGGLRTSGTIASNAGAAFVLGAAAEIDGLVRAGESLTLEAASLANASVDGALFGRSVDLRLTGALSNLGLIAAQDALSVRAGALTNGPLAARAAGGAGGAGGADGLIAGASVAATVDGRIVNDGLINSTVGALSLAGVALKNGGQINSAGDLALALSGTAANAGQIGATGALTVTGGSYAGAAGSRLLARSAKLTLGGDFANAGSVTVSGLLDLAATGAFANSGTIQAGAFALGAGAATNAGRAWAQGGAIMSVASLANSGEISAGENMTLIVAGDATNSGRLQAADAFGLVAARFDNQAGGAVDARTTTLRLSGALTNAGSIVAARDLQIAAGSLANAGGAATATISAADALSLSIAGALANGPNALIQARLGSQVSAASYSDGFLSNATIAQGLFAHGRDLDMTVTGAGWSFASDLIVEGDLAFKAKGDVVNAATVAAGGRLTLASSEGSIVNGTRPAAASGSAGQAGIEIVKASDLPQADPIFSPGGAGYLSSTAIVVDKGFGESIGALSSPQTLIRVDNRYYAVATGRIVNLPQQATGQPDSVDFARPVGGSVEIARGPLGSLVTSGAGYAVSRVATRSGEFASGPSDLVFHIGFRSSAPGLGDQPVAPEGMVAAAPSDAFPHNPWDWAQDPRLAGHLHYTPLFHSPYVLLVKRADGTYDFAPEAGASTPSASAAAAPQLYSGGAMSLAASGDIVNGSAFIQSLGDLSLNAGGSVLNARTGASSGFAQTSTVVEGGGGGSMEHPNPAWYQHVVTASQLSTSGNGVGGIDAQGAIHVQADAFRNLGGALTGGGDVTIVARDYQNAAATNFATSVGSSVTYPKPFSNGAGPNGQLTDLGQVQNVIGVYSGVKSVPVSESASSIYAAGRLSIAASGSYLNTGAEVAQGVSVKAPAITVGITDPKIYSPPARQPAPSLNLAYFLSSSAPAVTGARAELGAFAATAGIVGADGGGPAAAAIAASSVSARLATPLPPAAPRTVALPGAPGQPDVSVTYLYAAPVPGGAVDRGVGWILSEVGDARRNLTVFADPQTEQRLIQQALLANLGKTMLDPAFKTQTGQQAALHQGAVDFLRAHPDVRLGDRLTDAQRAGVSRPMLWYDTQDVGGVKTLVPELILPPSMLETYAAPTGGSISAETIALQGDHVTNAGSVLATGQLAIQADRFLNQARLTSPERLGSPAGGREGLLGGAPGGLAQASPQVATMGGRLGADTLSVVTDADLTNIGGAIAARSNLTLASLSGSVVNDALASVSRSDLAKGFLLQKPSVTGGSIMSGGALDVAAQARVVNVASSISAFGRASVYAGEAIVQQALTTSYLSEWSESGGLFSSKSRQVYSPLVFGASIASLGGDVDLATKGSIQFDGSVAQAAGALTAKAHDVALNSVIAEGFYKQSKSGFHGLSYRSVTAKGNLIEVAQAGLIAGDDLTVSAQTNVGGLGAMLAAGGDATISAGNDIVFDALVKNYWQTQKGWSIGLSTPLTSLASTLVNAAKGDASPQSAVWASLKMLAGMGRAGLADNVSSSPTTAGLWDQLTSVTLSFNAFKSRKDWTQSEPQQITTGGDLTLSAGHDVALVGGAQAVVGRNALLAAGEDVLLAAAHDVMRSKSSNWGASIGVSSSGVTIGGNAGGSKSNADVYSNARLQTAGDATIVAGRDIAVLGGTIASGADLYLNAARDLTLATLQDRSSSSSWSTNASITLSWGGVPTGASIGGSRGQGSSLWSNQVTTATSAGRLEASVGGATSLTGAGLWSRTNDLKLETARLLTADLADRSNSWSVNGGLSVGLGSSFSLGGISANLGGSYANKEGATRATLGQGAVNVRDGADLASLNRDPAAMQSVTSDEHFSFDIPELNPLLIQQTVKDAANYLRAVGASVPDSVRALGEARSAQFQRDLMAGASFDDALRAATTPTSVAAQSSGPGGERIWRSYLAQGYSTEQADAALSRPEMQEPIRIENNLSKLADRFGGYDLIPADLRAAVLAGLEVTVEPSGRVRMQAGCSVDAGPCDGPDVQIALEKLADKLGQEGLATLSNKGFFEKVLSGSNSKLFLDPEVQQALQKIQACNDLIEGRRVLAQTRVNNDIETLRQASFALDPSTPEGRSRRAEIEVQMADLRENFDARAQAYLDADSTYQSLTRTAGFQALQAYGFDRATQALNAANRLNFDLSARGLTLRYGAAAVKGVVVGVATGFAVGAILGAAVAAAPIYGAVASGAMVVAGTYLVAGQVVTIIQDARKGDIYAATENGVFLVSGVAGGASQAGASATALGRQIFEGYRPTPSTAGAASAAAEAEAGAGLSAGARFFNLRAAVTDVFINGGQTLPLGSRTAQLDAAASQGARVFQGVSEAEVKELFLTMTGARTLPAPIEFEIRSTPGIRYVVDTPSGSFSLRNISRSVAGPNGSWTIDVPRNYSGSSRTMELKFPQ